MVFMPAKTKSSSIFNLLLSSASLMLSACASIQPIGKVGPNKLSVYSISNGTFLSATQMIVILDKKGNVSAYSGGTVSGWGPVALQTGAAVATAGSIAYGANVIGDSLKHPNVHVKGIPSTVNLNANVNSKASLDINGLRK
jgi:hypothetical protein